MKFSIDRKSLYSSLSTVDKAVSALSPMAALSGILIDVKTDEVVFTGSNVNVSIRSTLGTENKNNLQIQETGSVVLEAKYLLEIIKKLDCANVEISLDSNDIACIKSNTGKFNLVSISASEYPEIDFSQPENSFDLNSEIIRTTIKQTIFACSSKDEVRPILTGVNFHADNHLLYLSATDSYRLARKTIELDSDQSFDVVVPKNSLNDLMHILSDDQLVHVYVNDKKIQFVTKDMLFQTNLIAGSFPNVDRIIPNSISSSLLADSKIIEGAVDRTNFIKNDKVHLVKFACNTDRTELKTCSAEIGFTNETLTQCEYTGEPLSLTLNGNYVLDAIKALGGEKTLFEFNGPARPLKISNPDDDSIMMILVAVKSFD